MISSKVLSEFLGTAGLLIVVVGSGIMGETLASGNSAVALLANSLATGAGLYALIQTFGPISGAHFNPAVSFIEWKWKKLSTRDFLKYLSAQVLGAIVGVFLTHAMFGQAILQLSTTNRTEFRFFLSEIIATFGLILVIALSGKKNVFATPSAVALYITSAYWCTSSTSFANPAVTIARSLTNTFSGILWTGSFGFIIAQLVGATIAYKISKVLSA
ncbi:MAG: aquaporin [Pseudobdellovibrionaceae bacterium]